MQYRRLGWVFTTFLLVFVNPLSVFGASPGNRSITRVGFRRLYISRLFRRNLGRLPIYHGVRLEAELDGQAVQPIINSHRPTTTIIGAYQFGFSLHTRQADLWSGGHFVFAILNVVTSGNPDVAIGDIQGVSSLYEQTRSRFHDIYFRQNVPFGVFRIGIMNGSDFFDVTLSSGAFSGYSPDFKINWDGTKNHYDLISETLTPTSGTPVPEPGSLLLLGTGLVGLGLVGRRKLSKRYF